jgi:hypothetical protein
VDDISFGLGDSKGSDGQSSRIAHESPQGVWPQDAILVVPARPPAGAQETEVPDSRWAAGHLNPEHWQQRSRHAAVCRGQACNLLL